MPTLFRLLLTLGLLGGLGYGAIVALANLVQPTQREMSVTVPAERLNRHR